MAIRCADHVTPLYPQKLALTSPTRGGRSVGIVRSRTKAAEFFRVFYAHCALILFLKVLICTDLRRGLRYKIVILRYRYLRLFDSLRSVEWQLLTDVSVQSLDPTCQDQAYKPSGRTLVVGSTQFLTEKGTRDISLE